MSTIEVAQPHHPRRRLAGAGPPGRGPARGGFERGGLGHAHYFDEVMGQYMGARMSGGDGKLLLGRWTYEKFEDTWQKQPEDTHPPGLEAST